MKAEKKLESYGIKISQSKDNDRSLIDFALQDKNADEEYANVWGDSYTDVDWECNHPYQCIDFGDGEEQCECALCGSFGDYHYEEDDEGHKVPEPHEWYPRRDVGGLIGEYLKELQGKNA